MDGGRHALVVANDRYVDPGLRRLVAPAQDAESLAETLADPSVGGFDVRVLHNESAQTIRIAVEDFFADRVPEDLLLLHFSCHGLKNAAGELFLAVADTRPTRLASTAVATDFVNRQMADSRAQRIALFLDCCYGGAFPRGMVVRAAGEAQVRDAFAEQERVGGGRGRVVVTASSAMEYAFEGDRLAAGTGPAPSVFTGAVVDGLTSGEADRDGDGWVGLTELVGYVTDQVRRATPHQTPQMWTFGAQGELLIARSRVRRITPAPLPPELLEAMDSPLTATRFGVVDDLRERLHDPDLGQAYAAWQALGQMVGDDSRKVSEAARQWVSSAVPRVSPEVLELDADVVGELQLQGPPLALTAVASATVPWLRVEQQGAMVRVTAAPGGGEVAAEVLVQGPTGERRIPVRVRPADPDAVAAPVPAPSVTTAAPPPSVTTAEPPPSSDTAAPAPAVTAAVSAPGPAAEPEAALAPPSPTTARRRSAVPWWAVGVLTAGALVLLVLNWPGAVDSRNAWYDEPSGWQVYRSWGDPYLSASVLALAAALTTRWLGRWAGIGLGVAAGSAVFLAVIGALYLAGGVAYQEGVGAWAATVVVAAGTIAVVLSVARPRFRPLWPVHQAGFALVLAGGLVLALGHGLTYDGQSFLRVTSGMSLIGALALVGLCWLALAVADRPASRLLLLAAVVTVVLLGVVGGLPAVAAGFTSSFVLTVAGHLLALAGVAVAVWQPIRQGGAEPDAAPDAESDVEAARPWWRSYAAAAGIGGCALLLLLVNWYALADGQSLWYESNEGSPQLLRRWDDGVLPAAVVALVAAVAGARPGRTGAVGLGVAAGAGALYVTTGVLTVGGGLGYERGVYTWAGSILVAAAMLGLAFSEARRRGAVTYRRVDVMPAVLLGVGFVVLVVAQFWPDDNGGTAVSYTEGLSLLVPVVAGGLVLLAASTVDGTWRLVTLSGAAAYLLLLAFACVYPIAADTAPDYFTALLAGHLALLTALVPGVLRR